MIINKYAAPCCMHAARTPLRWSEILWEWSAWEESHFNNHALRTIKFMHGCTRFVGHLQHKSSISRNVLRCKMTSKYSYILKIKIDCVLYILNDIRDINHHELNFRYVPVFHSITESIKIKITLWIFMKIETIEVQNR